MLWQTAFEGVGHTQQPSTAEILRAIPKWPSALINVRYSDMPGSPDILEHGKRATKALERCVSDNVDANNRALCAISLHALGDRGALKTLQTALEDWDPDVRFRVVRALGAMPDKSSVKPLIKLYKRKDAGGRVRFAVLRAFANISDRGVVRLLRKELLSKADARKGRRGGDVRPVVFRSLWANRHMMAQGTLVRDVTVALKSDNTALVLAATHAAAELRAPSLAPPLIALMTSPDVEVRNKAVYALGKIGNKTATRALLKHMSLVREARMLNNIAFALERLDKKAFYTAIERLAKHKQAIIRLNAAFVMGDVRDAAGLPLLERALEDSNQMVRSSALVAVGKLGNTNAAQTARAIKVLHRFDNHSDMGFRQNAVYAIDALKPGGDRDLIYRRLFDLPTEHHHRSTVHRSALFLARSDDTRVKAYVLDCYMTQQCNTKQVGNFVAQHADKVYAEKLLLRWTRGATDYGPLLSTLKPRGTIAIARAAYDDAPSWGRASRTSLDVLRDIGDKGSLSAIGARAAKARLIERSHSLIAAAQLGHDSSRRQLVAELDILPVERLPWFVRVVSKLQDKGARAELDKLLAPKQASKAVEVALAASALRLSWFPDKAIFRFIEALASSSSLERHLAERYLKRNTQDRVTALLRRAWAREGRPSTRARLRAILDRRGN